VFKKGPSKTTILIMALLIMTILITLNEGTLSIIIVLISDFIFKLIKFINGFTYNK